MTFSDLIESTGKTLEEMTDAEVNILLAGLNEEQLAEAEQVIKRQQVASRKKEPTAAQKKRADEALKAILAGKGK